MLVKDGVMVSASDSRSGGLYFMTGVNEQWPRHFFHSIPLY